MTFIPEPEDSGSSGTQTIQENQLLSSPPNQPIAGRPIEQVVVGLAATRSRSMGGEVAAGLIAGSFSQISHELSEARADLKKTRLDLDLTRTELQTEKVKNAHLQGKVSSYENEKSIRSICLVAGTAIAGFGIDQAKANQLIIGSLLIVVGVALALVGWFSISRGDVK